MIQFSWNISLTKLTKHDIITEEPPAVINPRRKPVHLLKQIEENINDVEKYEIIEKCESQ